MMMMIDNKNHYRNDDIDDNINSKLDHNTPYIITSYNINNSNNNDTMIIPNSFLTYFFNFDSLLPHGRLNGFQNMLTLINKQLINLFSSPTTTSTTTTTANTTANTSSSNEQTSVTLQIPSVTLTVISNSNSNSTTTSITTTTSSSNGTLNNNSTISNNDNHHHHDNINHLSTIQIEQLASRAEELSSEVAVLLSGGVDSSVALKLLIDEGMYVLMVIIIIMMKDI